VIYVVDVVSTDQQEAENADADTEAEGWRSRASSPPAHQTDTM